MRGLIAQIVRELLFIGDGAGFGIVAGGFQIQSAAAKPVMLSHGFDEGDFGEGFGLVLFAERGEDRIELGLRFAGEDTEGLPSARGGYCSKRRQLFRLRFWAAG